MCQIVLDNLHKSFGGVHAVRGVSLGVRRGELVTLLGPSGCGKTTTMQMIAGFHSPDKGEIRVDGRNVTGVAPCHRRIPMVFQDYALFPHMTVFENVAYGLKVRKEKSDVISARVRDVLELLGLPQVADRFPSQLSGGQQQRVALARTIILDPEALLLDEPLSNLDAKLRVKVREEIRQLQTRLNITMIYVTHDWEEALSISDRIAIMNEGAVEQFGTPSEIYNRPASEFVARFVGEANLLPVDIIDTTHQGDLLEVQFCIAGQRFSAFTSDGGLRPGQRRTLVLRPESMKLVASPERMPSMSGEVKRSSFFGATTRYWVEVAGQELVFDHRDTSGQGLLAGRVHLALRSDHLHFL